MHELSLSSAVVATVEKHAKGRKVSVVTLTLGTMRQVVPDSLAFYFDVVSRDTVCEGARLEQIIVEARLRCRDCDTHWRPELPQFRCAACGGADIEVLAGTEFEVDSIEVETEEEQACTAPR